MTARDLGSAAGGDGDGARDTSQAWQELAGPVLIDRRDEAENGTAPAPSRWTRAAAAPGGD